MQVQVPIKIRYAETDCMGVVYHANYLLYFEDARNAFLEAIGQSYDAIEASGYMSPVVSVNCSYGM
ncbi:MAG: thioesterase family protein, partial [Raoultibacter sp.]